MIDEQLLKARGFIQEQKRMAWINRDRRLWFSYAVIRDRDDVWLEERLAEFNPESEFHLHSNHQLSPDGSAAILKELDLSNLTAINRHWI